MKRNPAIMIILILSAIIICAAILWFRFQNPSHLPEKLTIAVPSHLAASPVYVALTKGFFMANGLEVALQKHSTGKLCLDAMLEGKADIALMADFPVVNAALNNKEFSIFATTTYTTGHLGIGGRKDRGISKPDDLAGKTIGVAYGTNHAYFLYTFLLENRIEQDRVKTVNLKSEQMPDSLKNGDVDAVCTTKQILLKIEKDMSGNTALFYTNTFIEAFNVAGTREFTKKNPETIKEILKALIRAEEFIAKHPEESKDILSESLNIDKSMISEMWDYYKFNISLGQPILISLEEQARWAIKKKMTDRKEIPNYLKYIDQEALQEVKPEAVTIIR